MTQRAKSVCMDAAWFAAAIIGVMLLFTLGGCVAGQTEAGEGYVGFRLPSASNAGSALASIGALLPPPWGEIVAVGVPAILGTIGITASRSAARNRRKAEAATTEADAAYDHATAAKVEAAELRGNNLGWTEREQAASVQAPLPVATVVPVAGVAPVVPPQA